jgi:hypothetical protein
MPLVILAILLGGILWLFSWLRRAMLGEREIPRSTDQHIGEMHMRSRGWFW